MIVNCAVYVDGQRSSDPVAVEQALATARETNGFAWIGLHEPSEEEFDVVARVFDLHPLAVEDAVHAHQRPKLERYGDTLFAVLKPARYVDSNEVIDVDQLMLFVGDAFVVTVRHGGTTALADVRRDLDERPDALCWGPTSVLHAVADKVVDDYASVLVDLEEDIDQIELAVFSGDRTNHAERIFKLKREALDFRRAVEPLRAPLAELSNAPKPLDERSAEYFRDVHDHLLRVNDQLTGLDALLDSALNANVAQVAMRQNEDMRKISAWVAIVAVPTMVAGIYGMNFEHMPELRWRYGYPFALAVMGVACALLYRAFKRRGWL